LPLRTHLQHGPSVGIEHAECLPTLVVERAVDTKIVIGGVELDD